MENPFSRILSSFLKTNSISIKDFSELVIVNESKIGEWLEGKSLPNQTIFLVLLEVMKSYPNKRTQNLLKNLYTLLDNPDFSVQTKDKSYRTLSDYLLEPIINNILSLAKDLPFQIKSSSLLTFNVINYLASEKLDNGEKIGDIEKSILKFNQNRRNFVPILGEDKGQRLRCYLCGRFVSSNSPEVQFCNFSVDSDYSKEDSGFAHKKCLDYHEEK